MFDDFDRGLEVRPAGADDADLIRRILAIAFAWREVDIPAVLAPSLDGYHAGWPRPDDLGVVGFRGIEFAGGAYVRRVGPADGTYGYVADEYRELTIGVEPGFRRQRIGLLCLTALQARVRAAGEAGISLSVEIDNPAQDLYSALGFTVFEARETDLVMVWRARS